MANISLPTRFSNLLIDQGLDAILKKTLSTFGEILTENKLYFFEEYTDHGISHIENVLTVTDKIIPENMFKIFLSQEDVVFYVLAVVLHDIGMHLRPEGFWALIDGHFDDIRQSELDQKTWNESWNEYLVELKKREVATFTAIFGVDSISLRDALSNNQHVLHPLFRRLVGEFIRRNHTRLAHEIALKGFPGREDLSFASELSVEERNLIGLIARSHGMNLRFCSDYLEATLDENGYREIYGVHPVYLMVLLRLSDYLQIDRSRTSLVILKTRTLTSSLSIAEHSAHLATSPVDFEYHKDPERLYVRANPLDTKMYLKLSRLFNSIQLEFDTSWAILGEVYGRFSKRPSLNFRRITSNISDDAYIQSRQYIADSFALKTKNELLKLLISPLYKNDPSYGVRELVQNSVDACLERKYMDPSYTPLVDVRLLKEEEQFYFCIVDNGVGMDIDVIKNYFLSIGSSHQNSTIWRTIFKDDDGKSKVRRTGKFGVGVLAAFLIGEEILVRTKHINDPCGYEFSFDASESEINVIKNNNISVGTEIKIKVSKKVLTLFRKRYTNEHHPVDWFNWFKLRFPIVRYYFFDRLISASRSDQIDDPATLKKWNDLLVDGFAKVMWSFEFNDTELYCNGFKVPFHDKKIDIFNFPSLSVIDNNGLFPLTLDRNSLAENLPFQDEIVADICKDFIAKLLTTKIDFKALDFKEVFFHYPGRIGRNNADYLLYSHKYYSRRYLDSCLHEIMCSKNGFILNYNYFIKRLDNPRILTLVVEKIIFKEIVDLFRENTFLSFIRLEEVEIYRHPITEPVIFYVDDFLRRKILNIESSTAEVSILNKRWFKIQYLNPPTSFLSNEFFKNRRLKILALREHTAKCESDGHEVIDNLLRRYIGENVVIPYDISERKAKFPLAFEELKDFMARYI